MTTRQYEKMLKAQEASAARTHAQGSHAVATDHLSYLTEAQQLHQGPSRVRAPHNQGPVRNTRSRTVQTQSAVAQVSKAHCCDVGSIADKVL